MVELEGEMLRKCDSLVVIVVIVVIAVVIVVIVVIVVVVVVAPYKIRISIKPRLVGKILISFLNSLAIAELISAMHLT